MSGAFWSAVIVSTIFFDSPSSSLSLGRSFAVWP
jgi:hypothetical protein